MSYRIKQEASYQGNNRWKWGVWIEAPGPELDRVAAVTYGLHPTFPQPIRFVTDRARNFRLDSSGWGEFKIDVTIETQSGKRTHQHHWLTLSYPDGYAKRRANRKQPVVFMTSSVADRVVAGQLGEALKRRDIQVLTADDGPSELPVSEWLRSLAARANAAVAVVSDAPSSWLEREMAVLNMHKLPVIPVVVGQGAKLPELLKNVRVFRIKGASRVESLAAQVEEEVRARAVWG